MGDVVITTRQTPAATSSVMIKMKKSEPKVRIRQLMEHLQGGGASKDRSKPKLHGVERFEHDSRIGINNNNGHTAPNTSSEGGVADPWGRGSSDGAAYADNLRHNLPSAGGTDAVIPDQLQEPPNNINSLHAAADKEDGEALPDTEPIVKMEYDAGPPHGSGSYTGHARDGTPHGEGTMEWPGGKMYKGQWTAGKRDGEGWQRWTDGRTFEGEWSDGKPHGKGVWTSPTGERYDGYLAKGKKSGEGVFTYPDGGTYSGSWLNGVRDGEGTRYYPDGSSYTGSWADDKRHGRGEYTWRGGKVWAGVWKDGNPVKDGQHQGKPEHSRSSSRGSALAIDLDLFCGNKLGNKNPVSGTSVHACKRGREEAPAQPKHRRQSNQNEDRQQQQQQQHERPQRRTLFRRTTSADGLPPAAPVLTGHRSVDPKSPATRDRRKLEANASPATGRDRSSPTAEGLNELKALRGAVVGGAELDGKGGVSGHQVRDPQGSASASNDSNVATSLRARGNTFPSPMRIQRQPPPPPQQQQQQQPFGAKSISRFLLRKQKSLNVPTSVSSGGRQGRDDASRLGAERRQQRGVAAKERAESLERHQRRQSPGPQVQPQVQQLRGSEAGGGGGLAQGTNTSIGSHPSGQGEPGDGKAGAAHAAGASGLPWLVEARRAQRSRHRLELVEQTIRPQLREKQRHEKQRHEKQQEQQQQQQQQQQEEGLRGNAPSGTVGRSLAKKCTSPSSSSVDFTTSRDGNAGGGAAAGGVRVLRRRNSSSGGSGESTNWGRRQESGKDPKATSSLHLSASTADTGGGRKPAVETHKAVVTPPSASTTTTMTTTTTTTTPSASASASRAKPVKSTVESRGQPNTRSSRSGARHEESSWASADFTQYYTMARRSKISKESEVGGGGVEDDHGRQGGAGGRGGRDASSLPVGHADIGQAQGQGRKKSTDGRESSNNCQPSGSQTAGPGCDVESNVGSASDGGGGSCRKEGSRRQDRERSPSSRDSDLGDRRRASTDVSHPREGGKYSRTIVSVTPTTSGRRRMLSGGVAVSARKRVELAEAAVDLDLAVSAAAASRLRSSRRKSGSVGNSYGISHEMRDLLLARKHRSDSLVVGTYSSSSAAATGTAARVTGTAARRRGNGGSKGSGDGTTVGGTVGGNDTTAVAGDQDTKTPPASAAVPSAAVPPASAATEIIRRRMEGHHRSRSSRSASKERSSSSGHPPRGGERGREREKEQHSRGSSTELSSREMSRERAAAPSSNSSSSSGSGGGGLNAKSTMLFDAGAPHGIGKYTGQAKDDKPDGEGTIEWPKGRRYKGSWKEGKREGYGTFTFEDGHVLRCEWADDKAHGKGTLQFLDGTSYAGGWNRGLRHGKGVQTYPNGAVYDGYWVGGVRQGKGVWCGPDGMYEGEYADDKKNGNGTYTWADGRKFVGQWQDGKQHGKGVLQAGDGRIIAQGKWKKGEKTLFF